MKTKTIITIIGESGSGKTFASLFLKDMFGWNTIVSYTTRKMRHNETNGIDHWFVKPKNMPDKKNMCAYTLFNNEHYWTTWEQFSSTIPNVYVIDEKGFMELIDKKYKYNLNLISIKIKRDCKNNIDLDRINRDKERIDLDDNHFNYIIQNNSTIENFKLQLTQVANHILEKLK